MTEENTSGVGQKKDIVRDLYKKKVNQRKGHRSYVTRVTKEVLEKLDVFVEDDHDELAAYEVALTEKMDTLCRFDDAISELLSDEEELEVEIGRASDLRREMQSVISRIQSKLKSQVTTEKTSNAKLPKLTLKSFSGNPLEFQAFWDSFSAAVHVNNSLEKITKFT